MRPSCRRSALLRRGGRIAWGVIDPVGPEPAGDAIGRSAACLSALAGQGLPLARIAAQSLLTPSCGTGRLSPERELLAAGDTILALDGLPQDQIAGPTYTDWRQQRAQGAATCPEEKYPQHAPES